MGWGVFRALSNFLAPENEVKVDLDGFWSHSGKTSCIQDLKKYLLL
jgi:hypothetical protein